MEAAADSAPAPDIELRQIGVERAGEAGEWEVRFLAANRGADALKLISARLPHGQFRGPELRFGPPMSIAAGETFSFSARVRCDEPAGLVTENAFVILLVQWQGERWRVFVRVRVTVDPTGVPRAITQAVTAQKVGFSGVEN